MGVVRMYRCVLVGVVVRRYILIIIITFPYSTCISSFLAAASLLLCSFLKCFFVFVCYFCEIIIANVAQRKFELVQKSRSCKHGDIINCIDKNVERTSTARARESQNFHVRGIGVA